MDRRIPGENCIVCWKIRIRTYLLNICTGLKLYQAIFAHSEHGNKIFVTFPDGLVLRYDLKGGKGNFEGSFQISEFPQDLRLGQVPITYVESLVSPGVNG